MVQFYSFAPQQTLKCFEKGLSCSANRDTVKAYGKAIHEGCEKIQEDFPGRRKSDGQREWARKAKTIQRQIGKLCAPLPEAPPASKTAKT